MASMEWKFKRFTDQQLAQMMGALNDGSDSTRQKLLTEISYRLTRAGGGPLYDPEEIATLGDIMDFQSRRRTQQRRQRRLARILGGVYAPARKPSTGASVICIR